MQTGEYRGFVGQFSIWLRAQAVTWRIPLLLSLALHVIFFWPKSLQEHGFGVNAAPAPGVVRAHLRPAPPALPAATVKQEDPARHTAATQASPRPVHNSLVRQREEPLPSEPTSSTMQVTTGLDAAALRSYRVAWARALMASRLREQLSPDSQGALEVGVALTASGHVHDVAVLKGSGDRALDNAVIAAMRNAVSAVQVPAAMRGRELVLSVPVEVGAVPPTSAAGR